MPAQLYFLGFCGLIIFSTYEQTKRCYSKTASQEFAVLGFIYLLLAILCKPEQLRHIEYVDHLF